MRKLYIVLLFCFFAYFSEAQNFMRPNEWKKYRREAFFTIGTSNFLGDLGGRDKKGTDYLPLDLNLNQSRTALGFGARYKIQRWLNVAGKFSYLNVRGDDSVTEDIYRNNRNLNFKSNIYELAARAEFGYQSTRRGGNKYGIRRNYGRSRNITHNLFVFIGIGGFYYNPKGRTPTGEYVALRPLHTEGQGLANGPRQYKKVSVSIPVGAALHVILSKLWSVGLEFNYRTTFTDYIDDVSTRYYDNAALNDAYGPTSALMADPSKGDIAGASSPNADGTGAQRGDKNKDSFMSIQVTVGRFFPPKRSRTKLRSKF